MKKKIKLTCCVCGAGGSADVPEDLVEKFGGIDAVNAMAKRTPCPNCLNAAISLLMQLPKAVGREAGSEPGESAPKGVVLQ